MSAAHQVHIQRYGLALAWLAFAIWAAGSAFGGATPAADYVRVSPRDARYFELGDGRPYIPIGFNLVGAPDEGELEGTLDTMAANKVNYCRVWLDQDPWRVEHRVAGEYDVSRVKVLRHFLDLAYQRGIRVKLCLEHFRDVQPTGTLWSTNTLQHRANGGPANSMEDFLASAEGQARFKRKLAFYRVHIGDHPAVFAWELWNEMNAVRAPWQAWTALMLPELHRLFPKTMAVQSLGSFDTDGIRQQYRQLCALPGNDVAQVHRYLDQGAPLEVCHGPVDLLAADAVRELLAMKSGRPVLLAETGAVKPRHTGCSELYARDRDGMLLHDMIFTPFFAGAAGSGDPWWWRESIERPGQWRQFARFARALEGIDPAAEHFEPARVAHPRLRVYLLRGQNTLLAWCRDSRNDWRAELERGEPPERLSGLTLDLASALEGRTVEAARVYSPWTGTWTDVAVKNGAVTLPPFQRSIVIRIRVHPR